MLSVIIYFMNVLFFLTPKSQIKYATSDMSVRQVLEILEFYRYSVIPLLNKNGGYIGTISEGDLLFFLKDNPFSTIEQFNNVSIMLVKRHFDYLPIDNSKEISNLIQVAYNQNFVPVLDDSLNFIGIVTRKSIINYLYKNV